METIGWRHEEAPPLEPNVIHLFGGPSSVPFVGPISDYGSGALTLTGVRQ